LKMLRDCEKYGPEELRLGVPNIYVGNFKSDSPQEKAFRSGLMQKDPVVIVSNAGSPKSSFNRGDLLEDVEDEDNVDMQGDANSEEEDQREEGFGQKSSASVGGKPALTIYEACFEVEQSAKRDAGRRRPVRFRVFKSIGGTCGIRW